MKNKKFDSKSFKTLKDSKMRNIDVALRRAFFVFLTILFFLSNKIVYRLGCPATKTEDDFASGPKMFYCFCSCSSNKP